jgi:hypothetical protein
MSTSGNFDAIARRADLLADVEHGRFVALAFADDDGAAHGDRVHGAAHGFGGDVVGALAIALPMVLAEAMAASSTTRTNSSASSNSRCCANAARSPIGSWWSWWPFHVCHGRGHEQVGFPASYLLLLLERVDAGDMLEPMISVWMSCVPSYVFTDSRFIMWRMIG